MSTKSNLLSISNQIHQETSSISTQNTNNNLPSKTEIRLNLRVEGSQNTDGPTTSPTRKKVNVQTSKGPTLYPVISPTTPPNNSANNTSDSASDAQFAAISTRAIVVIGVCAFLIGILFAGLIFIYNQDMWSNTVKRTIRRMSQHLGRAKESMKGIFLSSNTVAASPTKQDSPEKRSSVQKRGSVEKSTSPDKLRSSEIVWTQTKLSITSAGTDNVNNNTASHGTKILSQFGPTDTLALNRPAARRSSVRNSQHAMIPASTNNSFTLKPVADEIL